MSNSTISDNQNPKERTIVINNQKETNGIGIAGFVLAILSIFIGWIPFVGWICWFLGLLFSFIGVFKKPKGLAIAGLVISLIGIIFLLFIFAGLAGLAVIGEASGY